MRVLMFGWEFPPFNMGGLGTACHGLTKGLVNQGHDVVFVLPKAKNIDHQTHVNLVIADNLSLEKMDHLETIGVDSLITAYMSNESYSKRYNAYKHIMSLKMKNSGNNEPIYGNNLHEEVWRFSEKAKLIAAFEDFDVIHVHDWMTYDAGIKAKEVSGKPLVVHVHATEFDRGGGNGVNQFVYDTERRGMHLADKVITVSNYTKNKVIEHYGVEPSKIEVVHNSVEFNDYQHQDFNIKKHEKMVLFLGRITLQKGPEYYLYAAKRILEKQPNTRFIIAGTGDMEQFMMNKAAELGISHKVLFSGFLRGSDIDKAFSMADVYVMPSVSEPFGITPLEAMRNGTPCVISKQSGVSEVLTNCFKVDFWDIEKMSDMVLGLLKYDSLHKTMKENASHEINQFSWDKSAIKCAEVYREVIGKSFC